jgi:hypothetical protein
MREYNAEGGREDLRVRFKLDFEKLRASKNTERFLAFEQEMQREFEREVEERRRRDEENRRSRERRAKKRRQKVQAAQQA